MVDNRRDDELNRLRAEIETLLKLPALSPEFGVWLGKLFECVKVRFGTNSDEMRELRTISPELPNEFYNHISEKLEALGLNENWRDELLRKLNREAPKSVFDKRLYEYDSFIGALIHGLQARP